MKYLLEHIIVSVLVVMAAAYAFLFIPHSWLAGTSFGATFTQVQSTDSVKDAILTNINNGFTSVLSDLSRINGTTTIATLTSAANLATVGTITSGTWQGTTIGVPYGGTGWANVQSKALLYGNGTGQLSTTTQGSNGQVLIWSNGPTWGSGSVDQTLDYNWVGTSRVKTLIASSSVTFSNGGAGATYAFPTSHGSNSSILTEDGSGNLSWGTNHAVYSAYSAANVGVTNGYSTTTLLTVPAGILNASSTITIKINAECDWLASAGGTCTYYVRDSNGTPFGSITASSKPNNNSGTDNVAGTIEFTILPVNSVSSQQTIYNKNMVGLSQSGSVWNLVNERSGGSAGTSAITLSNATTFTVVEQSPSTSARANMQGISIIVRQ